MFSFTSKKKKREQEFDFLKQLHSVPVKNTKVETAESGDGYRILILKLEYTGLIKVFARVFKARNEKKYRLEGLGLQLYDMLDGKKNIENLIDMMIEKYKLSFFEARALIIQYLHTLIKRGLVVIAVKEE